jgi:hypothetical protein
LPGQLRFRNVDRLQHNVVDAPGGVSTAVEPLRLAI